MRLALVVIGKLRKKKMRNAKKIVFLCKRTIIMTNKAKPFIKWVGGKTQLIETIENSLPKDFGNQTNLTYIEPFVGGGAILFWILQKYPNIKKAVINDINPDLTTVYKTIKTNPKELIMELRSIANEYLPLSEERRKEYYLAKRDRFNTKSLEPVENSALFIYRYKRLDRPIISLYLNALVHIEPSFS